MLAAVGGIGVGFGGMGAAVKALWHRNSKSADANAATVADQDRQIQALNARIAEIIEERRKDAIAAHHKHEAVMATTTQSLEGALDALRALTASTRELAAGRPRRDGGR